MKPFDYFNSNQWDLSYAVMLGRGEAIQEKNTTNDNIELYLYSSADYDLPGGFGAGKNAINSPTKNEKIFTTETRIVVFIVQTGTHI